MMAALLLSLPGAFCLYQGDELGLPEAKIPKDIPEDKIRDPFGKALYPKVPGRDGSRTPMPWDSRQKHAGFTTAEESWLPIPKNHLSRSVDRQNSDPESLLNTWRRLLHWRRSQPALIAGDFQLLETDPRVLGFVREYAEQRLLCLFDISDESVRYDLTENAECESVFGTECDVLSPDSIAEPSRGNAIVLRPYSCFFANLLSSENLEAELAVSEETTSEDREDKNSLTTSASGRNSPSTA